MNRKIILVMLFVFLCGGSSPKKTRLLSSDEFGYSEKYNTLSNSKMGDSKIIELENELLFLTSKKVQMDGKEHPNSLFIGRADKTNSSAINVNENSGLEEMMIDSPKYYGDFIYYLNNKINEKEGTITIVLMRMNLDGTGSEEVCEIATKVSMQEFSICLVAIHQNHIYFSVGNSGIKRINIEDYSVNKEFLIAKDALVSSMFFYDDTIYFEAEHMKYEDDKNVNGVFKYTMKKQQMELIKKDATAYHIDNKNMIFLKEGEMATYLYNLETKLETKLFDTYSKGHFRYGDYYVIDANMEGEASSNYIVDINGNILDEIKEENNQIIGQGVFNEKYFVYDYMNGKFYYYNLSNGTFGDKKEVQIK